MALGLTVKAGYAVDVKTVRLAGPYDVKLPIVVDSVDASQKKFSSFDVINTPVEFAKALKGRVAWLEADSSLFMANGSKRQLMAVSFPLCTSAFAKGVKVNVEGPKSYKVFVDGVERSGKTDYQQGQYEVVVKYVADSSRLRLSVEADKEDLVTLPKLENGVVTKRPFSLLDVMDMKHYNGIAVSPSGKYATYNISWQDEKGRWQSKSRVVDVASKKVVSANGRMSWMPKSDCLLTTRNIDGKDMLVSVSPTDFSETVICDQLPESGYTMSPTEDFLILHKLVEGPQKERDVYQILTPDDRQPGWRNRYSLLKLDLKTGITQTLTFGNRPLYLQSISPDGKNIIFSFSEERLTKRPTSLSTYCLLNLETMECDTLIRRDGFINKVAYVPGTNKLVIVGSAEAFDRIGCVLPDSLIPNMYDYQMYLYDLSNKKVTPVTRDFDPSVADVNASQANGMVFFTANKADSVCLYQLNANTGKIKYVPVPVDDVLGFSVSTQGNTMMLSGCSACDPDKLLVLDTKTLKTTVYDEANANQISEIDLGTCHPFSMMSERGYQLTGHYYLPAHFDSAKKYPVIVHYYGGCSPTSRRFGGGSHYPAHYWNALGYVVLICNPSGASGFGQEWASRHVNTMGEGVAEDIIEMVKNFRDSNSWVDGGKIGCVSASYGGFMTQLLLTKTDIFAAGISHAGISDHTSYWGEGYWGYSYSQVSAADSYPWTRKDLFVDRSPLFNADKIKKPLLFTHGTADTNVPIGESIQMFTALKLLGVPTAFVMVEGENHGIMDFNKRQKWINTMVAWFDKYLKGDDTWWNAIYVPKEL